MFIQKQQRTRHQFPNAQTQSLRRRNIQLKTAYLGTCLQSGLATWLHTSFGTVLQT